MPRRIGIMGIYKRYNGIMERKVETAMSGSAIPRRRLVTESAGLRQASGQSCLRAYAYQAVLFVKAPTP